MLNLEYRWLSALLCYPDQDLLKALPEFRESLPALRGLAKLQPELSAFLDRLESNSLIHLQEDYVATFDNKRQHALYLFEHIHGEDRSRGSAMLDLLNQYQQDGFLLNDEQLPDYLPVLLEYMSEIDKKRASDLLGGAVHVIEHIRKQLEAANSPYATLLLALVSLSPAKPQPLIEPPVRDMDEAMEIFGPSPEGIEPLLKPSIETIKFYPDAKRVASKGSRS